MLLKSNENLSIWALILNLLIFIGKLFAGLISNSVSLLSDSLDALEDIFSSIAILIAIKVGNRSPDDSHPFGYNRAEPLAGFVIALFTAILGFQVISMGVRRLINPEPVFIVSFVFYVIIISMLIKFVMYIVFHKKGLLLNSPALLASAVDSRNDVFRSAIVLAAVISTSQGFIWVGSVVAIVFGIILFYSAYSLGKQNIDMLMGKAPSAKFVTHIKKEAKKFSGINGVGDIRAHYTGNSIQLEIVVKMNPRMTVKKSHEIAANLRDRLQEHPEIGRVFVHVDPSS